jgi:hypothetical protein
LNKTAASIPFLNVLHRVFFAKRPSADKIKDTCVFGPSTGVSIPEPSQVQHAHARVGAHAHCVHGGEPEP